MCCWDERFINHISTQGSIVFFLIYGSIPSNIWTQRGCILTQLWTFYYSCSRFTQKSSAFTYEQFRKGPFWSTEGSTFVFLSSAFNKKHNNHVVLQRQAINKAQVTQLNTQRSHQVVDELNLIEVFVAILQNESHLSTCQYCALCKYICTVCTNVSTGDLGKTQARRHTQSHKPVVQF